MRPRRSRPSLGAEPQFERVARVEHSHWWFAGLRELVRLSLAERLGEHAAVLDAGCGTGQTLAELPESWRRTGFDLNPGPLAIARKRVDAEFIEASINDIPLPDDSFDAAVSLDVLCVGGVDEHAALCELRRVLRPGGTLVLNLPAYEWLRSGHDVVANSARRYTARRLRRLLRDAGFEVERLSYRVTAMFPAAAAARLIRRGRTGTDVGDVNPAINRVLTWLLRVENRIIRRLPLPFGLSVFAVARAQE